MSLFESVIVRSFKRRIRTMKGERIPLIAGHKLLYTCNLKCKMCPFWRRPDEKLLTVEEEKRMMFALKDFGVSFMGFEGGEPLLRHDISQILSVSHNLFHTSLVTNGWMLKEKIGSIGEYLDHLFVSIDGVGKLHDEQRGVDGSFEKAVEGIRAAAEYVPVTISSTITAMNVHQVDEVLELAKELGVSVNFQIAYNYSTAEFMSPELLSLKRTIEKLRSAKVNGAPIVESVEYFDAILNSWYSGIKWECKPWLTINIDPKGRVVLPCYVLNEYTGGGRVWEIDLPKMWNSIDWDTYRTCNKCALSCYLEPSLFRWTNPSMVKERIVDSVVEYIMA
ncbi:MAG: PTO1314 family radical SAM protein [Methanomassiliicoccales archaeon]